MEFVVPLWSAPQSISQIRPTRATTRGLPYRYFGSSLHSTASVHLTPPSPRTFLRGISTNGRQRESGVLVFMLEHGQ